MNVERPDGRRATDPGVDHAWRSASNEEPPPHLDAAILSAARSRRPRLGAWQPLAAVATVAALAFLLVQLMPRERNVEAPVGIETTPPAPPESGTREETKATTEEVAPPARPAPVLVVPTERTHAPRQSARSVGVAAPPDEQQARDFASAADARSPAPAVSTEAAAGNAMRAAESKAAPQVSPEQWSALIEALYRSGDVVGAELQLRAFRAAHADADQYLPQDLRDWATNIR